MKETNPNSPYITGKKMMITPVIKSVMKQNVLLNGDKQKRASLLIEWREKVNDINGKYIQTSEYKGTFIFDIIPPQTEADITRNPFGIQVSTIQIVPVRIVDKAQDNQPLNSGIGGQNAQ
jgi:type IV secretory pathway TrbF-like protein